MNLRSISIAGRLLAVMLPVVLSACSSFDAQWHTAKDSTTAHGPTRWDGRWTSEKHRRGGGPEGGRLRCLLIEVEVATNCFPTGQRIKPSTQTHLRADFHANWLIFASSYTMTLTPVPGSPADFRGTHELPRMFGGTYHYTARIGGDRFTARYESGYDHGIFDLTRVRR